MITLGVIDTNAPRFQLLQYRCVLDELGDGSLTHRVTYLIDGFHHGQIRRVIRRSRELGFSIAEIRGLLALVDGGDYTCGEVKEVTVEHLRSVRKKIADLRRLEKTLARISSNCEGGAVPECPVIDALFRASA